MSYIYVAILLAGLGVGFTGGWKAQGWRHGAEEAIQAREERAREETRKAAQLGAAEAIAANKPINTTIVQKTQKEIRENTIYADCRVPAGGMQLANQALTGRTEPAGGVVVPATDGAK